MDSTIVWILVIIGVVLVAASIAWVVTRELRSRHLKERFGPEYERMLERTHGDRKLAESALGHRVSRREELELKPLSPAARETYLRRWEQVQAEFVDRPGDSVRDAQVLLDEVMAERGYPVGDEFEEQVELISVDHHVVVEHYRVAHGLHGASGDEGDTTGSTEVRRQALVHYRALFADLLGTAETDRKAATDIPETS